MNTPSNSVRDFAVNSQRIVSPSVSVGLAFAAACLTVAVRLRRNREPI